MNSDNQFSQDRDSTLERRTKIIEMLDQNGQVKVNDLSKRFSVSEVTIRNDLSQLESKGLLVKTRGGGILTNRVRIDNRLNEKSKLYSKEKYDIGKAAASMIGNNDTIILDSGTTTAEIARNLNRVRNLTVITNSINIVTELVSNDDIKVIMLGGLLRNNSLSLVGPIAETNIMNYYCDKLFLGVDGIDAQRGISTPNFEEAHLNRLMINLSKEVIVVTDSSKFYRKSFALISPVSDIDVVITDSNIPEEESKNLRNAGIKLIIV